MQIFKKILYLLSSRERKYASLLILMILIMALFDMIGVASVMPFIAVLANPNVIETNFILINLYKFLGRFGVENNKQFIAALGILSFVLLVASLVFKTVTTYLQVRFAYMREYTIGKRLLEGYLRQPYTWFLNHHSDDVKKTILSEVDQVVGNAINPLIDLIAKSALTISLIFLLIIIDPKLAIIVGFTLSFIYGILFYFIRSYLNQIGKERLKSNRLRFIVVNEFFAAIKEIKIGGLEKVYVDRFSNSAKTYSKNQATGIIISHLPRFFVEAITFGGVFLMIIYLITKTGSFADTLPIVTLYVFAGYRLMPALQQIYVCLTQLSFVGSSVDNLYNNIKELKLVNLKQNQKIVSLNKAINLKNVYYQYLNSKKTALKNINMTIPAKSIVGIVGPTGSGKTTLVEIILGLLEVQQGTLQIDEQIIKKNNYRSWQRSIGYVPQYIYLVDDTVVANIAFGVDPQNINQKAVEKAARIANLHEFITNELPELYKTKIGERGVKLSGGQRQRFGIARALYHNPKVLILDEATSSLDNLTEKSVMEAINNLKDMTIIIIAHRLSTVKNCDITFILEKGKLEKIEYSKNFITNNKSFVLPAKSGGYFLKT
jgi:ABC-type multidrug transport system fused ATPase/permease subunit